VWRGYIEVLVANSTGLSGVMVTVRGGGATATSNVEPGAPQGMGTDIEAAGEPARFHVEIAVILRTTRVHVHADAIGNPDNVSTAVIYGGPLRVVCRSGWQEEEVRGPGKSGRTTAFCVPRYYMALASAEASAAMIRSDRGAAQCRHDQSDHPTWNVWEVVRTSFPRKCEGKPCSACGLPGSPSSSF
jgi:hypothetical protein